MNGWQTRIYVLDEATGLVVEERMFAQGAQWPAWSNEPTDIVICGIRACRRRGCGAISDSRGAGRNC